MQAPSRGEDPHNDGSNMKHYEMGVVYRFWADDDEHALEQLANATSEAVVEHVNYQAFVNDETDESPIDSIVIHDCPNCGGHERVDA